MKKKFNEKYLLEKGINYCKFGKNGKMILISSSILFALMNLILIATGNNIVSCFITIHHSLYSATFSFVIIFSVVCIIGGIVFIIYYGFGLRLIALSMIAKNKSSK